MRKARPICRDNIALVRLAHRKRSSAGRHVAQGPRFLDVQTVAIFPEFNFAGPVAEAVAPPVFAWTGGRFLLMLFVLFAMLEINSIWQCDGLRTLFQQAREVLVRLVRAAPATAPLEERD